MVGVALKVLVCILHKFHIIFILNSKLKPWVTRVYICLRFVCHVKVVDNQLNEFRTANSGPSISPGSVFIYPANVCTLKAYVKNMSLLLDFYDVMLSSHINKFEKYYLKNVYIFLI